MNWHKNQQNEHIPEEICTVKHMRIVKPVESIISVTQGVLVFLKLGKILVSAKFCGVCAR